MKTTLDKINIDKNKVPPIPKRRINNWQLYERKKPNKKDYFKNMNSNSMIYYSQAEKFFNAQDEFIQYLESKIEAVKKAIEK